MMPIFQALEKQKMPIFIYIQNKHLKIIPTIMFQIVRWKSEKKSPTRIHNKKIFSGHPVHGSLITPAKLEKNYKLHFIYQQTMKQEKVIRQ